MLYNCKKSLATISLLLFSLTSVIYSQEQANPDLTGQSQTSQIAKPEIPVDKIEHCIDFLPEAQAANFPTVDDLASFCLGYRLGDRFRQDRIDAKGYILSSSLFLDGMNDGFLGKQPQLSKLELTSAIEEFKLQMRDTADEPPPAPASAEAEQKIPQIIKNDADFAAAADEIEKGIQTQTLSKHNPTTETLQTKSGKFSYAIGFQTGAAFKLGISNDPTLDEPDEFNDSLFLNGFRSGYSQHPLPIGLTNERIGDLLYTWHLERNYEKEASVARVQLLWLEENAKNEGIIETQNGLQYRIINPGDTSKASPTLADSVVISYQGKLIDDTVWDSTDEKITAGMNQVLPGVAQGLALIGPGGEIELYIPSYLGYGAHGNGDAVPAYSTLIIRVNLHNVLVGQAPVLPAATEDAAE